MNKHHIGSMIGTFSQISADKVLRLARSADLTLKLAAQYDQSCDDFAEVFIYKKYLPGDFKTSPRKL